MTEHVAALRAIQSNWMRCNLTHDELAALTHAIAAVAERDKLRAELSVRGDYVNEAIADKHAALVARLGEFADRLATDRAYDGDIVDDLRDIIEGRDLARVVKENNDGR